MFSSSVSSCRNYKCSKKDSCLRYTTENDNIRSETYLVLTEEECEKSKSYINKDELNLLYFILFYFNLFYFIFNCVSMFVCLYVPPSLCLCVSVCVCVMCM